jgi:hypothetical protein
MIGQISVDKMDQELAADHATKMMILARANWFQDFIFSNSMLNSDRHLPVIV